MCCLSVFYIDLLLVGGVGPRHVFIWGTSLKHNEPLQYLRAYLQLKHFVSSILTIGERIGGGGGNYFNNVKISLLYKITSDVTMDSTTCYNCHHMMQLFE